MWSCIRVGKCTENQFVTLARYWQHWDGVARHLEWSVVVGVVWWANIGSLIRRWEELVVGYGKIGDKVESCFIGI